MGKTTHGMKGTLIYATWCSMKSRCSNPNVQRYSCYGGRGIKVCPEWMSFETFYADMGEKPEGRTIDRIDNDKDYSKENCKWSTREEQVNNKSNNVVLFYKGKTMNLVQWSKRLGIDYQLLGDRIRNGWSVEKAFGHPKRQQKKRRIDLGKEDTVRRDY